MGRGSPHGWASGRPVCCFRRIGSGGGRNRRVPCPKIPESICTRNTPPGTARSATSSMACSCARGCATGTAAATAGSGWARSRSQWRGLEHDPGPSGRHRGRLWIARALRTSARRPRARRRAVLALDRRGLRLARAHGWGHGLAVHPASAGGGDDADREPRDPHPPRAPSRALFRGRRARRPGLRDQSARRSRLSLLVRDERSTRPPSEPALPVPESAACSHWDSRQNEPPGTFKGEDKARHGVDARDAR